MVGTIARQMRIPLTNRLAEIESMDVMAIASLDNVTLGTGGVALLVRIVAGGNI